MTNEFPIIGGFFPLELSDQAEYHLHALHLNSARYCLEYILRVKHYSKIYLTAYICDSVLQPIKRLDVPYTFYRLNSDFLPVFNQAPEDDACILYVNYFGLNHSVVQKVCEQYAHVIIDNTQGLLNIKKCIDTTRFLSTFVE